MVESDLKLINRFSIKNSKSTIEKLREKIQPSHLGFIGLDDSWIAESDWIGYIELKKFILSVSHPVRAYKIWAELFTGQPIYSWTNKPIWWSINVKPTETVLNLIPELVDQTILLKNNKLYFKKDGFSGNDHFVNGVLAEFRKNFVYKLDMKFLGLPKKKRYSELRRDLFHQFYENYDRTHFYKLLYRKQRPSLFILNLPKLKFHLSWVRLYNETKRNHAWRGDKGALKVRQIFNSFPYRKILDFEPISYAVSTSKISYKKILDEFNSNRNLTIDSILNFIQSSRGSSRIFFNELIGTEDVKPPLIVETNNIKKYRKENFPRGQVTVIQAVFQKNKIMKFLNVHHNIHLPLNGVYKFKGQSRGKSSTTTTIFEDISATTDTLGYPLLENVNILIKNSTEFVKQRLIEDRLFKLLSFPPKEKSINIVVDVTHPDNLEDGILQESQIKAIENHNSPTPFGWIDIGIHLGTEAEENLSSVYGAIKYSRSKNQSKDHVDTAERILLSHHLTGISRDLITRMDRLFQKYEIQNFTPRDLNKREFLAFTIDFIDNFLSSNSQAVPPTPEFSES
ncbi:hypothetical protein CEE45_03625 [Candidatus Heimdallarchaeota archaeon B3_Heim]|nr:MAG: hypothetical protein CEE45_03625 [Candidatus Heimdallarchaeota archaeon B3_Heim]